MEYSIKSVTSEEAWENGFATDDAHVKPVLVELPGLTCGCYGASDEGEHYRFDIMIGTEAYGFIIKDYGKGYEKIMQIRDLLIQLEKVIDDEEPKVMLHAMARILPIIGVERL